MDLLQSLDAELGSVWTSMLTLEYESSDLYHLPVLEYLESVASGTHYFSMKDELQRLPVDIPQALCLQACSSGGYAGAEVAQQACAAVSRDFPDSEKS